ncbi:hypothetical protein AN643_00380 [Candidatus Epulonipiscioides saccharophilum]|nr:hypothetical protein AN643_00380 [Epulopiscium sp. SCG-B10WGA-EpuloB]
MKTEVAPLSHNVVKTEWAPLHRNFVTKILKFPTMGVSIASVILSLVDSTMASLTIITHEIKKQDLQIAITVL